MRFLQRLDKSFEFLLNVSTSGGFYGSRPRAGRTDTNGIPAFRIGWLLSQAFDMPQMQDIVGVEMCRGTGREIGDCVSRDPGRVLFLLKFDCKDIATQTRPASSQSQELPIQLQKVFALNLCLNDGGLTLRSSATAATSSLPR